MLTPPNEALAARDVALPGLGLLLDSVALAAALGVQRVELRHLRYKPGTSCAAAVVTEEGRWLRLRALTPARFTEEAAAGHARLAAACVELGTPADDRDVAGLRRLWPERTRGIALAKLFGEGRLATARMVPLSYRLGRRLVARLDHPDGSALLKIHAPGRFAQAQAGALAAAFMGHAPMERACSRQMAVVTRWLPGETLSADRPVKAFAAAGAALATLHQGPPAMPFPRSRADEIATVSRALDGAGSLLPDMADWLADLLRRLAEALAGTPADPGPIHGDFSADQVVMHADRARLIDWDRAGTGDRATDLGSALARLDADRISGRLLPAAACAAAEALLDGYAARRTLPPAVEVQRLAHLAGLATEPFRRQAPDWPGEIAALVAEVGQRLDRLCEPEIADAALPQLATLLSPAGAQAVLDACGGGRLATPPRMLRHKPGRRALIEMAAHGEEGALTWLAKTRSKRPDHAAPALHHALRAAGFDGRRGSPFGVPLMRSGPEGMRTCLIARVPGRPLADWQEPDADTASFRAAGCALAALHACDVDPGRTWSFADEESVALRALDAAAERCPGSAERIARLRARAAAFPRVGLDAGSALLHRDFYPDQALVDGDRLWLIDLDLAARGDAHVDLGNMLAHLSEYAIRRFGDPLALAPQADAFLGGYSDGGGKWSETALHDLHTISLMRHLDICLRLPGRADVFRPLLDHLYVMSFARPDISKTGSGHSAADTNDRFSRGTAASPEGHCLGPEWCTREA